MAKEEIVINEPDETAKDFEEGTLLQIEGKVFNVEEDSLHTSASCIGNTDFWLNTKELLELYFKLGRVKL